MNDLFYFVLGVLAEKLQLSEGLRPLHDAIVQQAKAPSHNKLVIPTEAQRSGGTWFCLESRGSTGEKQVLRSAQDDTPNEWVEDTSKLVKPSKPESVLLLAHGTPDALGEMDAYLKLVTGGRGLPPHVVHELQERYAEIGLREEPTEEGPHLTRWTLLQGHLLAEKLGVPVYVGMRNSKPFIADVVAQMKADGITEAKTVCLAPQNSRTSVGLYKRAVETAAGDDLKIDFLAGWAEHPLLARAFAEKMRPALDRARTTGARTAVLFTAHSVPCRTVQASVKPVEHHGMVLATEPDTYNSECKRTAKRIAAELGIGGSLENGAPLLEQDWYFCFQSQGLSGGPWIGPSVEDTFAALKQEGYEHVVMQPVGFLCDHVEILYDIDIAFQQTGRELGLIVSRAESLNDSPTLIAALEDVVLHGVASPAKPVEDADGVEVLRVLAPLAEPAPEAVMV